MRGVDFWKYLRVLIDGTHMDLLKSVTRLFGMLAAEMAESVMGADIIRDMCDFSLEKLQSRPSIRPVD